MAGEWQEGCLSDVADMSTSAPLGPLAEADIEWESYYLELR